MINKDPLMGEQPISVGRRGEGGNANPFQHFHHPSKINGAPCRALRPSWKVYINMIGVLILFHNRFLKPWKSLDGSLEKSGWNIPGFPGGNLDKISRDI